MPGKRLLVGKTRGSGLGKKKNIGRTGSPRKLKTRGTRGH